MSENTDATHCKRGAEQEEKKKKKKRGNIKKEALFLLNVANKPNLFQVSIKEEGQENCN